MVPVALERKAEHLGAVAHVLGCGAGGQELKASGFGLRAPINPKPGVEFRV